MVGFAPNTDEVIPMYMTHCDNYGNDDGNCSISLSLSYGSGVSASNESWVTNGEVSYVSTVCASKDGGRHNAYNMGKKYSLTNIKMPYTMKKDSFSFKNAETNFSFSRNESSDYAPAFGRKNGNAISKKLAESMLSSPTLKTDTARAALKEIIADDFKGFCYGMSITSGKIYAGSLLRSNLGDADAKTTYEMKKPSENVLLQEVIVFYNILRNAKMLEYKFWSDDKSKQEVTRDFVDELRKNVINDTTFIVCISMPAPSNLSHALLAYDLRMKEDGTNEVYCYDPNNTAEPLIMTISSDFSSITYSNTNYNGCYISSCNSVTSGDDLLAKYSQSFNAVKLEMDEHKAMIKAYMKDLEILIDSLPPINIKDGEVTSSAPENTEGVLVKENIKEEEEKPEGIAFVPFQERENITVEAKETDRVELYADDTLVLAENPDSANRQFKILVGRNEDGKKKIKIEKPYKSGYRVSIADNKNMPKDMGGLAIEGKGKGAEIIIEDGTVEITPDDPDDEITLIPTDLNSEGYEIYSNIVCSGPIIYSRNNGHVSIKNKNTGNEVEGVKRQEAVTIKFDANGAAGQMSDFNVVATSSPKLPDNKFSRVGYTFQSWNTAKDGSGTTYKNKADISELVADKDGQTITLYAQWKIITYTIRFYGNGNTGGTMNTQTFTIDTMDGVSIAECAFTKTGHSFKNWKYYASDNSEVYYDDKAPLSELNLSSSEIKIYAQWELNSEEHEHLRADKWSSDADKHWHACLNDGDSTRLDEAVHEFEWITDLEPTVTTEGRKHEECKLCKYAKTPISIDNLKDTSSGGSSGSDNGSTSGGGSSPDGDAGNTGNGGNTDTGDSEHVNNTKPVDANDGNKVTTTSKGEATVTEVKKTSSKSITVSSTTTVDGVKYNVTTINANAFKNATKAKTVTLPNTITKIKANAFASSKIETVKITIKKGGKLTIDKKAFKKSKVKNVQVTMNKKATKKEQNAVINAFKKAGIKVKNIKLKLK